jgi:UDP-glucuronate decarboxylase
MMNYYKGKRVAVPGGAGFIGTHLVNTLLDLGAFVTVYDDFCTGQEENLHQLRTSRSLKVIEHDIIDPLIVDGDVVFNLACPASPVHYQRDPVKTWRSSVIGMNNLMESCRKTGARLVQASTSEVYGDPLVHPQAESYWGNVNPNGPRACYDEGKRAAETLALDFHRNYGVDVRIARIFNTYGPVMAVGDGRVVSNFCVQALQGDDLTIYGDGSHTRSFCYVSDMVRGLLALGSSLQVSGKVVNLGNPQEVTMFDLARKILKLTGSRSRIVHMPLPQDDPMRRLPDISRAQSLLNWSPEVELERGLQQTAAFFSGKTQSIAYPLDAQSAHA